MIAVDTNILVYGHRVDSPWHTRAKALIRQLAEGANFWAIPWPCVHELLAVVTHPRVYKAPSSLDVALSQVDAWMESPTLVLLGESDEHWPTFRAMTVASLIVGPKVHDARVAALCVQHGVRELWSADRDFGAMRGITPRNPLLGEAGLSEP